MEQGRPTKVISMMKWIRTSKLSMKKSLSLWMVPSYMDDRSHSRAHSCTKARITEGRIYSEEPWHQDQGLQDGTPDGGRLAQHHGAARARAAMFAGPGSQASMPTPIKLHPASPRNPNRQTM